MRVAVIAAVYNEENNISLLLNSLLRQTRMPDEIIVVDDGSTDRTAEIIKGFSQQHPVIRYLYQENRGPATARNKAWRNTRADLCLFTDGDCVPDEEWVESLIEPFKEEEVGAAGGTYRTQNSESVLARFIGYEIAWRYRNVKGEIDVHGSYNLAIRRRILEELGGYKEKYRVPSGEDWDLTYRISSRYKMKYVPQAVVGHYHPDNFSQYMRIQFRRAYDRVMVYNDHPGKLSRDTYTNRWNKYQALAAGALIPAALFLLPLFPGCRMIPLGLFAFLFATAWIPFPYYFKEADVPVALYSIGLQIVRSFAWFLGALAGYLRFGLKLKPAHEKSDEERKLESVLAA